MLSVSSLAAAAGLFLAALPVETAADPQESAVRLSVVKIFATKRSPDVTRPWKTRDPHEISGSGVVIEGQRILTNAHVAEYASRIYVQPDQSSEKLTAKVEAIAPGIDLAVLKLADPTFFEKHPPLPRATELPEVKDVVHVYGYPQGGESLSITRGIVSRIEFDVYYYDTSGVRVQVDAAINPGNSGGPALVDDRMIGIIFSRLDQSDNIGYIIPSEEIELFLKDISDGKYEGKPAIFDEYQTLENDAIRAKLKLDKTTTGIMIWEPYRSEESYPLKPWDILTKIGDHDIDNTGMVQVKDNLRLRFKYFAQKLARNNLVPLEVIRSGRRMTIQLPVSSKRDSVMQFLNGRYPSYFIWGPLVFSTATENFVHEFDDGSAAQDWYPYFAHRHSPLVTRANDRPKFEGEELVIVASAIFPHQVSKGYSDPYADVVDKVNGTKIRNLRHLVETLRDAADEYVVISFAGKDSEVLVFNRQETLDATEEILNENSIRKQCSSDLQAIWDRK